MSKMLLMILLLLRFQNDIPEKTISYLPQHFIGKAAVIYGQTSGADIQYVGERRIYNMPVCGILKTKFSVPKRKVYSSATIDNDVLFVYRDSAGHVTDTLHFLPNLRDMDSMEYQWFYTKSSNKVFILQWGFGGISFGEGEKYKIESYIVDTLKNQNKYRSMLFEKSDLEKCD